jgi:hypothetical protein
MKVRFKSKEITQSIMKKFNNTLLIKQDFHLDIGGDYLVLGLYIQLNGAIMIDCLNKYGHLGNYPLDLFEIIDGRASKYWHMKVHESGEISFLPKEYYDNEYFHDDLSEDVPEIIMQFQDLLRRLNFEYS